MRKTKSIQKRSFRFLAKIWKILSKIKYLKMVSIFHPLVQTLGGGNISRWHEIVYIRQQQAMIRNKSMSAAMKMLTQEVKLQLFVLGNSCTFIN